MQAHLDPTAIVEDCNNGTDQSTTVQVLGPASLQPGKPERVKVSVRNTSQSTLWFGEQTQVATRLGAWNGSLQGHNNQVRWDGWECGGYRKNGVGDQRSFISDPKSPDNNCHAPGNVGPNAERTFDFNITAPLGSSGSTKFSWAMVVEFGAQCNGFFKEAWYVDVPVSGAGVTCSTDPGPKANDSQFLLEVWNNETLDAITGTDGTKTEDAFPVERRWVNADFVTDATGSVTLPLDAVGGQTRLSQCAGLAHYTARLTGSVPLKAGTYTFKASADDGVRVSVNNAPLINRWAAPQSIPDSAPEIARGTAPTDGSYTVVIEYLQADGGAHLNLNWALEGTLPVQPPTLTLNSASGRTAVLSWTSVTNASTYSLKRGTAMGGPYPQVIPVSGTGTSDTVSIDGDYYYVVTATVNGVETANSNEVHARLSNGTQLPTAPQLTLNNITGRTASFSWNAISGASGYTLKRGIVRGGPYPQSIPAGGTSATDTVNADGDFYYVVTVTVAGVESGNSNEVPVRFGTGTQPPNAPQLTLNSVSGRTATFSWNAPTGATGYNFKRGTTQGGPYPDVRPVSGTSMSDTVVNDGAYYYVVSALANGLESGNSNEIPVNFTQQPPANASVKLEVVDAAGAVIADNSSLGLNADGWPSPNPLQVRVSLSCPQSSAVDCDGQMRLSLDAASGRLRLYGISNQPVCELVGLLAPSQSSLRWDCPSSVLSGVVVRPGETRMLLFQVVVQPSDDALMRLRATWNVAEASQTIGVPRAQIHPLIVIPGILGTMPPFDVTGMLDPILGVYDPLMEQLAKMGYEEGTTLFRMPYDWRNSNFVTGGHLAGRIQEAIAASRPVPWISSGSQVDLVVHSMGGLITRVYVQGQAWDQNRNQIPYRGDIRKVVFVATPHRGFPEDYKVYEGSQWDDFLYNYPFQQFAMNTIFWPAFVRKHWTEAHPNQPVPVVCNSAPPPRRVCISDTYAMSHDAIGGISSLREMLPTEDVDPFYGPWLCESYANGLCNHPYPFRRPFNTLLNGLNPGTDVLRQALGPQNMYVIYGTNPNGDDRNGADNVDVVFDVSTPLPVPGVSGWANGSIDVRIIDPAGDDLIPEYSANLRLLLPSIPPGNVAHLTGQSARHIPVMYDPNVQTVYVPRYLAGMSTLQFSTAHQTPPFLINPTQWYVLAALCPVNLLITDTQGRKLGYDPATGTTFNQIPAALYAAPNSQNQFMILKDPPAGRYHLKVSAFGDGEFSLGLHQLAPGLGAPRRFLAEGFVHNGEVLEYDIDIQPDLPISNTPPIADAGPDRAVPSGAACKADVTLDGSGSRDPDGEPLQYQWTGKFGFAAGVAATVSLPVGINDIRLVVLDGQNSGAEDSVRVTVTAPTPIVNAFAAQPSLLQPADGSLRDVKVVVDISNTCGSAMCRIVTVESDEGDSHDWKITGPLAVKLRAERSADSDGRTYKLRVECQIPGGDPIVKTVRVKVPPPGRMKGEGKIEHDHREYSYKFDVSESRAGKYAGNVSLDVKHDDDDDHDRKPTDKFRATRVDAVRFSNDDDLTPGGGLKVDTVHASGVGTWNGKAGYAFELRATDAGEPGADHDRFKIVVRDANGKTVARVDEKIDSGNNQSQKPPK